MNPKANQIEEVSQAIKRYPDLPNQDNKERYEFIHQLVLTVSVLSEAVEIKINPQALFEDLPHPIESITIPVFGALDQIVSYWPEAVKICNQFCNKLSLPALKQLF